jgi:chitin disaccharide deacetylase
MARLLIVNGDDLGASAGVNLGILEAHEHGILTSASLMVDRPAAEAFAANRAEVPRLSVGLHATLPDTEPELLADVAGCGRELERQLERFEALMGCPPTHLDSHHNIHLQGPLADLFQTVARARGLTLRGFSPARYFADFYGQFDGETDLELISVETLSELLSTEVGEGVTEFGCHPGYAGDAYSSSYLHERETEVRTLCDPAVRVRLDELGIELISFYELAGVTDGDSA